MPSNNESPKGEKNSLIRSKLTALLMLALGAIGAGGCDDCAKPAPAPVKLKQPNRYGPWTSSNMTPNELVAARHLQGKLGGDEPLCRELEALLEERFSKDPRAAQAVRKVIEISRRIVVCVTEERATPQIWVAEINDDMGAVISGPFPKKGSIPAGQKSEK